MDFFAYYRKCFWDDYSRFVSSIPEESQHHESDKSETTIQYSKLFRDQGHIDLIRHEDIPYFAVSLFLTILVDEVMYTHFKQHYPKFRRLTMYPKFIGDCPGGCHYHRHPSDIFSGINSSFYREHRTIKKEYNFRDAFLEAIPVMKTECDDFIEKHIPEIGKDDFWSRCVSEFPY